MVVDRIIFLDVDGVINHTAWYNWVIKHPEFLKEGGHKNIDPRSVERIIKICDEAKASIVLSSSWRLWEFYQTIKNLNRIRDIRPILERMVGITERTEERFRGKEIDSFLKRCQTKSFMTDNGNNLVKSGIEFNVNPSYVILDDDNDMLDFQLSRFIYVNDEVGVTHKDVDTAIKILNGAV